jgi:hypothetical protein
MATTSPSSTSSASTKRDDRSSRIERTREDSLAVLSGETSGQRSKKLEARADVWAKWIRQRMDDKGCADPSEMLPEILARMDQTVDDRVAAAIQEFKRTLRKALTT